VAGEREGRGTVKARPLLVFDDGKTEELAAGVEVVLFENRGFRLLGLEPRSAVGVRLAGDESFRERVRADGSGSLAGTRGATVPQRLGIAMRGGETFEVRVEVGGRPLVFAVAVEHNRFSAEEVQAMLDDLGAMDIRWDAEAAVPTRVGDLEARIERLRSLYPRLEAAARRVIASPDRVLTRETALVPLREARDFSPSALRRNVAAGRITPDGDPVASTVYADVTVESPDTAANARVRDLLDRVARARDRLVRQVDIEDRRLERVAAREAAYRRRGGERGPAERAVAELRRRLGELRRELRDVEVLRAPGEWYGFLSVASAMTNAARYDGRYAEVEETAAALLDERAAGTREDRLQRIAAFGKRPHDELFEAWSVAKTIEALYRLGFRTAVDPGSERPVEAFLQLESDAGGMYGLKRGHHVSLVHKDARHLFVRVGYEPTVPHGDGFRTPDIMLVLRGSTRGLHPARHEGRWYRDDPFYLDAKYRSRSMLGDDAAVKQLGKYVGLTGRRRDRRPFSYLLQAAPDRFSWLQRTRVGDSTAARRIGYRDRADREDLYPYRVGAVTLQPRPGGEPATGMTELQKALYAWLVSQGVVCVCPRCGGALRGRSALAKVGPDGVCAYAAKPYLPEGLEPLTRPSPRRRTLVCERCDLGLTVNFCSECFRAGSFVPIVKLYPRTADEDRAAAQAWISDYEIAYPSDRPQMRHCPRCGAAPKWDPGTPVDESFAAFA